MFGFANVIFSCLHSKLLADINSIQFKKTLLGCNDYGTQIYADVYSLFSDTKKYLNHFRKDKKQKTTTFIQIGSNITLYYIVFAL